MCRSIVISVRLCSNAIEWVKATYARQRSQHIYAKSASIFFEWNFLHCNKTLSLITYPDGRSGTCCTLCGWDMFVSRMYVTPQLDKIHQAFCNCIHGGRVATSALFVLDLPCACYGCLYAIYRLNVCIKGCILALDWTNLYNTAIGVHITQHNE